MDAAKEITSKFEMDCRGCDKMIAKGDKVYWLKGLGQPAAWHVEHGREVPRPPKAASTGSGDPKPAPVPPAPVAVSQPAAAVNESPEFAERVFVQIAGWVPADRAQIVVEAIVRARMKP